MPSFEIINTALLLFAIIMIAALLLRRGAPIPPEIITQMSLVERSLNALPQALRDEARASREDLRNALTAQTQSQEARLGTFDERLNDFAGAQTSQLSAMRTEAADGRAKLEDAVQRNADSFAHTQTTRLKETNDAVQALSDRLLEAQKLARQEQGQALEAVGVKIAVLTEANNKKQDEMRDTLSKSLDTLRTENETKLEQMRLTVDEKLQGTLEKRLGESFQLVSDRLNQVHEGLGEMRNLAVGVGDLKRVLSNVKSRGGWGEGQVGMLLDDMLTPDQFERNVRIRPDSTEQVEFAVRLPGSGDRPLYLPIDAKFPKEDYERLLAAQDSGVPEEVEKAAVSLERAIRLQAKTICEKYIHPPYSTDFAVMFLPTEGLFAEVIRRPGLASELQSKHRVMVTGPTTLAAVLSSLQMGFRTLAIEKRSSEVWQVLGDAKAEFLKYGKVWERLGNQLDTARRTVDEAGRRTRAVERKLRAVEVAELPLNVESVMLGAPTEEEDEE